MEPLTVTKEWANCKAVADVVVGGEALLKAVPVSYLLFLEKQLTDVQTFVRKLPALDPAQSWEYNAAADAYATPPVQTTKTKKVYRNHVKAEATEKHPAQVDVYTEDVIIGYWRTTKYSGTLPAARKCWRTLVQIRPWPPSLRPGRLAEGHADLRADARS